MQALSPSFPIVTELTRGYYFSSYSSPKLNLVSDFHLLLKKYYLVISSKIKRAKENILFAPVLVPDRPPKLLPAELREYGDSFLPDYRDAPGLAGLFTEPVPGLACYVPRPPLALLDPLYITNIRML